MARALGVGYIYLFLFILGGYMKRIIRKYGPPIFHCINDFGQGSLAALIPFLSLTLALIIINRLPLFSVTPWWPLSPSLHWAT